MAAFYLIFPDENLHHYNYCQISRRLKDDTPLTRESPEEPCRRSSRELGEHRLPILVLPIHIHMNIDTVCRHDALYGLTY